jgi:hypothetical protein
MFSTFALTVFAWIFFRANNIKHAFDYISQIFSRSLFTYPIYYKDDFAKPIFILLFIFVIIEWFGREQQFAISRLGLIKNKLFRYAFYYAIIFALFWFSGEKQEFIYFQF